MSRSTQTGKTSGTADPYLTWQDLLAAEADNDAAPAAAADNTGQPPTAAAADEPWPATAQVKLPPDVAALLAEKDRLEDELKRLTGLGTPRPEDERQQRMYPVKVHTKESRIEDRRLRQHDEHQRLLKQRVLEAKLAQAREDQRQAELAAESHRKTIERALARVRAQLRQAELAAERRRKAIERTQAALRQQERQAEHAAEQQRKAMEQALVQERWASDRQKALLKGAQERRQATLWQEEDLSNQRTRAIELARTRKAQLQDDLSKNRGRPARVDEVQRAAKREQHPAELADSADERVQARQQARLDEAKRTARLEKQPEEAGNTTDGREYPSAGARLDALQRLYQKNRQALMWEQERERLRANALQRRRDNQTLADHLDRRGKNTDRFAATA